VSDKERSHTRGEASAGEAELAPGMSDTERSRTRGEASAGEAELAPEVSDTERSRTRGESSAGEAELAPERSEFRVVSSTEIADAGFLTVTRDVIAGPGGDEFERHVVHHPGAVVVVPVDDAGRVVLVRQYRVAVRRSLLEAPAGKTDVPGEAPDETARRELVEEVGLQAGSLVRLVSCLNSPGFTDEQSHVYLATDLSEVEHARVGPEEAVMTIERIPLADIDALIAAGEIEHATSVIGLLLARRYLAGEYDGASR
jgi:8-oxo-dGTP pyrophosphatase MutT (NUDIX family)